MMHFDQPIYILFEVIFNQGCFKLHCWVHGPWCSMNAGAGISCFDIFQNRVGRFRGLQVETLTLEWEINQMFWYYRLFQSTKLTVRSRVNTHNTEYVMLVMRFVLDIFKNAIFASNWQIFFYFSKYSKTHRIINLRYTYMIRYIPKGYSYPKSTTAIPFNPTRHLLLRKLC